jgi:iron complex transport system ATP-binding protein
VQSHSGEGIRAGGVSLWIGPRQILRDVSLEVRPGEMVGLVGPNGAGKSTLLRVLDRLLRPQAGFVSAVGKDINAIPMRRLARTIGFMSQEMAPAFSLPVLDVVLMGRYAHTSQFGATGRGDEQKAQEALEEVGLGGFEARLFQELSTGERQLVLFARLLAQDTPVMLLDEPTANLDIRHRHRIYALASRLADSGRAVLAAIHDVNEAAAHCSRIVLLDRGEVAASGPPEEVLVPETLAQVYRVRVAVSRSSSTGALLVEVLEEERRDGDQGVP